MLDINLIREKPEIVKASEKRRGHDLKVVDEILRLDEQWKKELQKMQELNHQRNVVSEEINQAKKAKNEALAKKKMMEKLSVKTLFIGREVFFSIKKPKILILASTAGQKEEPPFLIKKNFWNLAVLVLYTLLFTGKILIFPTGHGNPDIKYYLIQKF